MFKLQNPLGRHKLCGTFFIPGDQSQFLPIPLCLSRFWSVHRTQRLLKVCAKQVPLAAGWGGSRALTL